MPARAVEVEGLRELRRELKRLEGEFPKELRQANKQAAEAIVPHVQRRVPVGPHEGGGRVVPARASVRALASQARGQVAMGSARSPHALAVNFGGTIARSHSTARTRISRREALFAGIEAGRDDAFDAYGDAVDRLTRRAFPERR